MVRSLMLAAVAALFLQGNASAQPLSAVSHHGPAVTDMMASPMMGGGCASCGSSRYGWAPMLRKLNIFNRDDCQACGQRRIFGGWLRDKLGFSRCGSGGWLRQRLGLGSGGWLRDRLGLGCGGGLFGGIGLFNRCGNTGRGNYDPYVQTQPQGTLVFPYNYYLRSPRDFFMMND